MFRWVVVLLLVSPAFGRPAQQSYDALTQLSNIRLDKSQILSVRDITINRDVLSISLNRGAIAFTEAVDGKVTGAVFVGSGDILAIPPDAIEKRQLFRYTKSALLTEHFETAIFRFTDETREELLKEVRRHPPETVEAADIEALLRWESEIQRRGAFLNDRLLADLIASKARPFFLAQIEGSQVGWFDALYDDRRSEEVVIQQHKVPAANPLIWVSFNKRSESGDPAAVAHEDKSVFEIQSADAEKSLVRIRLKGEGERLLILPLPATGVGRVSLDGKPLSFVSSSGNLAVILPAPGQTGSEIALEIEIAPENRAAFFGAVKDRTNSVAPASYRDEWIIEGLASYGAVISNPAILVQAREQLLATSPEGGSYDSLGPVWIGFRMTQPNSDSGSVVLRAKSIWILHMLRNMMRRDDSDVVFGRFLDDIFAQGTGSRISTFDVKRLAEKQLGRPLDWFFDAWVFGTGIPAYAMTSRVEPTTNGFVITGTITQSGVPASFEMQVPVYADQTFLGNVTVSSDGGEFRFISSAMPQQILLDPNRVVLRQD
ncbi:MAG TPA: hypothetical protein VFR18_21800 [Terriglobia bacterium]|nr:hypothetical protein [Terriglobia bacterium]